MSQCQLFGNDQGTWWSMANSSNHLAGWHYWKSIKTKSQWPCKQLTAINVVAFDTQSMQSAYQILLVLPRTVNCQGCICITKVRRATWVIQSENWQYMAMRLQGEVVRLIKECSMKKCLQYIWYEYGSTWYTRFEQVRLQGEVEW